jgi:hypothetical protein
MASRREMLSKKKKRNCLQQGEQRQLLRSAHGVAQKNAEQEQKTLLLGMQSELQQVEQRQLLRSAHGVAQKR